MLHYVQKKHKLNVRYLTFEDDVKHEGFTGKEDFVLAVPPYPFEEMVHDVKKIKDQFDIHAGAFRRCNERCIS